MASVSILDGGLGTSLEDQYGVKFDSGSTPLWSSHLLVSDPHILESCQRDFANAGIDVILTATYQVSIEGFGRTKTSKFPNGIPRDAIAPFIRKALEIAENARGRRNVKVALSLGPYGACMIPGQEYSGLYDDAHNDEESLYQWHLERLRLFKNADENLLQRIQFISFETLPRLDEVRAVRRALHDADIEAPFWISCVFPREDDLLPDGSTVDDVVRAALSNDGRGNVPWGIGINCTKIHKLASLIKQFNVAAEKLVEGGLNFVLYPDGTNGEVYNTTTQTWDKLDDTEAARAVSRLS